MRLRVATEELSVQPSQLTEICWYKYNLRVCRVQCIEIEGRYPAVKLIMAYL